jgi:Mg-chelatase subunit ChlD
MRMTSALPSAGRLARNFIPIVLGLLGGFYARAQDLRLDFSNRVHMVDCQPVSSIPCFSTSFNIVDSKGAPYAIELPEGQRLVSGITITADGAPTRVFYANTAAGTSHKAAGRIALILVDISGSMAKKLPTGETRFDAARSALVHFLDAFQDGVDQVAIVPFESHRVDETIRSAVFAHTRQEAIAQLDSLRSPQPSNNTALFSAVVDGLSLSNQHLLQAQSDGDSHSPEALLVVMTDGRNEVLKGDDPGLLTGEGGLEEASRNVSASRIPVIGIGFGERSEIDEAALGRLSTQRPYMANDSESLKKAFTFTRRLLVDRIQVAFLSPWPDRAALAGKTITFNASLLLPDGRKIDSNEVSFETPQMGIPLFSGKASLDELAALSAATKVPTEAGWTPLLRPIVVFLGLGGVLVVAWFWIPRLVWPGQYLGQLSIPKPAMRWSSGPNERRRDQFVTSSSAPSGFLNVKGRPAQRRPQDATMVQPMGDATRMRLDRDLQK